MIDFEGSHPRWKDGAVNTEVLNNVLSRCRDRGTVLRHGVSQRGKFYAQFNTEAQARRASGRFYNARIMNKEVKCFVRLQQRWPDRGAMRCVVTKALERQLHTVVSSCIVMGLTRLLNKTLACFTSQRHQGSHPYVIVICVVIEHRRPS